MRLPTFCAENGIALTSDTMERIFRQTRDAAQEIISRKGATYYAVAAGLMRIGRGDPARQNTVLSISSLITGLLRHRRRLPEPADRAQPARHRTCPRLELSPPRLEAFRKSADVLRQTIESLREPCRWLSRPGPAAAVGPVELSTGKWG